MKGHETNKELIWQKEKKQESDNARKRKRDAIVTDIKELEAKKIALEKVEKKLKTDSELLLIKAAEDAKNANTYAVEGKIIMEEHNKKRKEKNKLEDSIKSLQEKCKEL